MRTATLSGTRSETAALLGPGVLNIVLVLALTTWPVYARVARNETLAVKERDFVTGVKAIGGSGPYVTLRHVLPNILGSVLVVATLEVSRLVISEAFLSFLGLGVPDPIPSWGGMLSAGREYMLDQWWLSTFPGLAIFLACVGMNFLGDWIRDVTDPSLSDDR